ncbi:MAG TPA: hypothetical protein VK611_06855 [Acidimicrobiales bacterium]|nr:hypothetical protein [Acidimicrobiales bacterium]
MGFLKRQRGQEHPESWIFGPKRSVRRDVTESLAENGRPLRWTIVLGVGIVGLVGLSAVAPMSPIALVGDESDEAHGVPEGTQLTPSGKLVVKQDGTVIDAMDVRGAIWVQADDVRITRTRVTGSSYHTIRVFDGADGTIVEDTDVVCTDDALNGGKGVVFGNYTATRLDVTGCGVPFVTASGNVRVTDSFADGEPVDINVGGDDGPTPPPATPAPSTPPTTTPAPPTTRPPAPPTTTPAPPSTTAPPTTTPPPPGDGRFPDASSTGVPAGVTLRPSGSVTVTTDGAVVGNLHVTGSITVEADDVVIRNTRIDNTATYPIRSSGRNLLVEDSEIDGNGTANVAILPGEYTLRRVDIHDVKDGPRIEGDNVVIEDSYIHHLHRVEGGHHDAIQIRKGSNIQIRRNNLQAYNADTGDPMNAAIQIGSLTAPMRGLVVDGNLMDGGNYTVNSGKSGADPSYYRNNVFGRNYRYGVLSSGPGVVWESSNVWQDTGQPAR